MLCYVRLEIRLCYVRLDKARLGYIRFDSIRSFRLRKTRLD
jgi:hypothetical protein